MLKQRENCAEFLTRSNFPHAISPTAPATHRHHSNGMIPNCEFRWDVLSLVSVLTGRISEPQKGVSQLREQLRSRDRRHGKWFLVIVFSRAVRLHLVFRPEEPASSSLADSVTVVHDILACHTHCCVALNSTVARCSSFVREKRKLRQQLILKALLTKQKLDTE